MKENKNINALRFSRRHEYENIYNRLACIENELKITVLVTGDSDELNVKEGIEIICVKKFTDFDNEECSFTIDRNQIKKVSDFLINYLNKNEK